MPTNKKTNSSKKKSNTSVSKVVKKTAKKTIKSAKKGNKGAIAIIVVVLVLLLVAGGVFAGLYFTGKLDSVLNKDKTNGTTQGTVNTLAPNTTNVVNGEDGITENIIYDNFQIHFLELGNDAAGDSIFIKAGNNDILIDAGSTQDSATTIKNYLSSNQLVTDNKLEYVIGTHGDFDHISGMYGKKEKGQYNGILYSYKIDTIIKQAYTTKTTTAYQNYLNGIDYAVSQGAKCYTAADCFNKKNGASNVYELSENIKMSVLYNRYYFYNDTNDENNYSVCVMFTYNDLNYIFTGDLEKEGEESMASYYDGSSPEKTLPKVELYKAGHHGSKTSSNECLLEIIQPKICVACCCAGTSEYTNNLEHQFPTQAFINRIAKYTSRVYVPSMIKNIDGNWTFTSMNGNIIVSCNGSNTGISASNNLIRLKDSEWFNEKIYAVKTKATYAWNEAGDKFDVYQNCSKADTKEFYTKDTPNAVVVSRRTWPSNGVQ